jgi:hypothetical protein
VDSAMGHTEKVKQRSLDNERFRYLADFEALANKMSNSIDMSDSFISQVNVFVFVDILKHIIFFLGLR